MTGVYLNKISKEDKLVHGYHIYGNLYGCDKELLRNEKYLQQIITNAAILSNMKLVSVHYHKFGQDSGISIIAIVAESHISIHTWPEYEFATVDVYTCSAKSNPFYAFYYIAKSLNAKKVEFCITDRSLYSTDTI